MKSRYTIMLDEEERSIIDRLSLYYNDSKSSVIGRAIRRLSTHVNPDIKIKELKCLKKRKETQLKTDIEEIDERIKELKICKHNNDEVLKSSQKKLDKYALHIAWLFFTKKPINDINDICDGFSLSIGFNKNELYELGKKYYDKGKIKQLNHEM